jgi:taurine dioxygenase
MTLTIRPTGAAVGAVVTGFDSDAPSDGEVAELYRAFLEYGVLVLKGLKLDPVGHLKLAGYFGTPKDPHMVVRNRHPEQPRLNVLASNGGLPPAKPGDPDADEIIGKIAWHGDHLYTVRPYKGALLHALVVPEEGGHTGWIDTQKAYRERPYVIKCRLQTLRIVHSYGHAYANQSLVKGDGEQFPAVSQPLVIVHPENDRPGLNAGPAGALKIIGCPEDEAAELFDYLVKHLTREEEAYIHHWEPGDIVAWDNLRTIHRAYGHPRKYARLMHSAGLKGEMITGQYFEEEASKSIAA